MTIRSDLIPCKWHGDQQSAGHWLCTYCGRYWQAISPALPRWRYDNNRCRCDRKLRPTYDGDPYARGVQACPCCYRERGHLRRERDRKVTLLRWRNGKPSVPVADTLQVPGARRKASRRL